jgi:hypothetical protein
LGTQKKGGSQEEEDNDDEEEEEEEEKGIRVLPGDRRGCCCGITAARNPNLPNNNPCLLP